MDCDEKAALAALIAQCNFAEPHMEIVLATLTATIARRRQNQDFVNWPHYLSKQDWSNVIKGLAAASVDQMIHSILSTVLEVVLYRFGCLNPTEGTKKWTASCIISILEQYFDDHPDKAVPIVPEHVFNIVKDTWTPQKVLRIKTWGDVLPEDYIVKLPITPVALLTTHPNVLEKNKHHGFHACPLDLARVSTLDRSYSTRGGGAARLRSCFAKSQVGVPMITLLGKSNLGRSSQLAITDGSSKPENPSRLQRSTSSLHRSLLCLGMDDEELKEAPEGSTIAPTLVVAASAATEPIESSQAVQNSCPVADMTTDLASSIDLVGGSAANDTSNVIEKAVLPSIASGEIVCSNSTPEARKLRGNELLEAMLVHQKDTQQQAAFKRIEARKQKAAEAALASKVEMRKQKAKEAALASTDASTPLKKVKVDVETPPSKTEAKPKTLRPKPTMSHEASRKNWQVRSGKKGPGQNQGFRYGEPNSKYATKEEAEEAAKKALRSFKVLIAAEYGCF